MKKITLLVNWESKNIITLDEFLKDKKETEDEMKNENSFYFSEWLSENYNSIDIWLMAEDKREKIWELYNVYVKEYIEDTFDINGYYQKAINI